ncbi:MAG TPA: phosphotransferase [Ktedonobacteraceae bacterium]|nr:phosphotransferase [Ktedonobacteraceae bacterium]
MIEQQNLLVHLVEKFYACGRVSLQPISPYMLEDRGIYRVDCEDGTSYVLRAFRADVKAELTGHAAVLDYLLKRGYVAPQVMRTRDGAVLACYEGWTALLISFLAGEIANFTLPSLYLLAACAGHLHMLTHDILVDTARGHLPDSRLRPTQSASQAVEKLTQALSVVPDALYPFCEDALQALQRIQQAQQASLLPETIIHGDCWPGNAVQTCSGNVSLIDWDGAGIGPAVLDIGYLLLTCHLGKPQLPSMEPDEERIAVVVRGYCQQRKITAAELNVLEDAVLYDVARRAGLEQRFSTLSDNSSEEIWWQKMLARYQVSSKIAKIARRYFEQDLLADSSLESG